MVMIRGLAVANPICCINLSIIYIYILIKGVYVHNLTGRKEEIELLHKILSITTLLHLIY